MKKALLSFFTGIGLLLTVAASAQNVAVNATGATADPSAMLDINAANAGLLVPRVTLLSLTDATTIANPATSLLVYNIAGANVAPGYYYNSGTPGSPVWTMLATNSNSYWTSTDGLNIYNTNTGSVGIGEAPSGLTGQNIFANGTNGYAVTLYQNAATVSLGFGVGLDDYSDGTADVYNFENGPIRFGTNGTFAAVIAANGNLGIGTATPVAKTEITAFGPTNNIYTIASGYDLVTGSATYESDSTSANEQVAAYAFSDGSSLENESIFGEAGSTGVFNLGVYGRVSFAPTSTSSLSSAVLGYDAIGTSNTYAGYFEGKVITYGNTSIFGSSPAIMPSASWIGFDASAYSSNTAVDDSVSDAGLLGYANGSTSVLNSGVIGIGGITAIDFNVGVAGLSGDGPAGTNYGVFGQVLNGADHAGFFYGNVEVTGNSTAIQPTTSIIGFDAATYSTNTSNDDSVSNTGVLGYADGSTSEFNVGVTGIAGSSATYNVGLIGAAFDGADGSNIGIFAQANTNADDIAGYFVGNVSLSGTLNATGTKNFQIDHPLDPANKILRHAAIESNEVLDMYSGNITTDGNGYATVQLPDYFETINKDFRYQLTVMGTFAQAIIKQKISANQFIIQTNQPNVEVSWQVAGVRNDKEMQAHPFVAEEVKTSKQIGKYFQPELYGQPASAGIMYMPRGNGKPAAGAAHHAIPSLKAVAGSAHKSVINTKPVFKGSAGSVSSNNSLKKSSTNTNVTPASPAKSLTIQAQQAKAAGKNLNTTVPKQ